MKKIEAWQCEVCRQLFSVEGACRQHEEICRWTKAGHAVWIEAGEVKHNVKVPAELFGPHAYSEHGTSDCKHGCGCWMGGTRSSGPVDPFGLCPNNPKTKPQESAQCEVITAKKLACPGCGGSNFVEGQCGGGTRNVRCLKCGQWWMEGLFGLESLD